MNYPLFYIHKFEVLTTTSTLELDTIVSLEIQIAGYSEA